MTEDHELKSPKMGGMSHSFSMPAPDRISGLMRSHCWADDLTLAWQLLPVSVALEHVRENASRLFWTVVREPQTAILIPSNVNFTGKTAYTRCDIPVSVQTNLAPAVACEDKGIESPAFEPQSSLNGVRCQSALGASQPVLRSGSPREADLSTEVESVASTGFAHLSAHHPSSSGPD
jgi:hypothetical protein